MMTKEEAIQQAIDAAWNSPDGAELREKLFPEGKPSPELFVQRMAAYGRQRLSDTCKTL